mgnify:CR=1 FL=1
MIAPRASAASGYTVLELVVTAAVLSIVAGVAVVALRPAERIADLRTAVCDTANTVRMKASSAARGSTEHVTAADIRSGDKLVVNPRDFGPPGAVVATEFALQGGTGTAYCRGVRAVVAIVIADAGDPTQALAVVAGTAGRVEILRYDPKGHRWEADGDG